MCLEVKVCVQLLSNLTLLTEAADLFLTPLKPPSKTSIEPEAVQSCLYYLHVEQPEDESLRETLEEEQKEEEQRRSTEDKVISRKPLPTTPYANYPLSERPPTPPKAYPHYQPPILGDQEDTQAARHAARASHVQFGTPLGNHRGSLRRKPVGPRPLDAELEVDTTRTIPRKPLSSAAKENEPLDPGRCGPNCVSARRPGARCLGKPRNWIRSRGEPILHTTLVRRDPASGSQWNIARITMSTDPLDEQETVVPVCIEISTPGYQKFKRRSPPPKSSAVHELEAEDVDKRMEPSSEPTKEETAASTADQPYPCLLMWMSSSFLARMGLDRISNNTHGAWRNSHGAWRAGLANAVSKPRPRFTFHSPWQGDITFSPANDGRSLRGRHQLNSNVHGDQDPGNDIALIRFNLPWRKPKRGEATNGVTSSTAKYASTSQQAIGRAMRQMKHKSLTMSSMDSASTQGEGHGDDGSDDDNDNDRMDLSLGQEKAGGGFLGKSAKLGKLIIQDEGLKMCDLVVAACLGIFWQQYLLTKDD